MRVLALTEGPGHVCCRYRIEAFAWAMAEQGLLLDIAPLGHGLIGRMRQIRRAASADVVILQRKLLPFWQLRLLRRWAKRLVYDVDDALFQRDSYSPRGQESWSRMLGYWATVQAADAVTVGNEFLRRRTEAWAVPGQVHVVPTCVDPKAYTPAAHHRRGRHARLVWIGQKSTLPSLHLAADRLNAAGRRLPGLTLRAISDQFPRFDDVRVVQRPWSSLTEADDLADSDIGVSWLPDDSWSRGKCGLKVLQYMAAGLPVVANPLGMNREMVVDGQTGLLADTPDQWADAIERLAHSPDLRRQMGQAGRRRVEELYGVEVWGPRFAQLIRGVALGQTPIAGERVATSETAGSFRERQPVGRVATRQGSC